jgi:hypothetical protein
MTKLPFYTALLAGLLVAAPALAAETHATPTPTVAHAAVAAQGAARADPQPAPLPAPGARNCLQHTGSLIPPAKGRCLPVTGTSYSRQDLERTGAIDIGRALQRLDPSVTLGH